MLQSKKIIYAVVAIIKYQDEMLFLKRNNPPLNWCPPCGRIEKGETKEQALIREVFEEIGQKTKIEKLLFVWQGKHYDVEMISYNFLCSINSKKIILSSEHSDYRWIKISKIEKWQNKTDFDLTEIKRTLV